MIDALKTWPLQHPHIEDKKKEVSKIEKLAYKILFNFTAYLSNTMHYAWSVISFYCGKISSIFSEIFHKKQIFNEELSLKANSEVFKEVIAGFDRMHTIYQSELELLNSSIDRLVIEDDRTLAKIKVIQDEIDRNLSFFKDLKSDYILTSYELSQLENLIKNYEKTDRNLLRKFEDNRSQITHVFLRIKSQIEKQTIEEAPFQDLLWYLDIAEYLKKHKNLVILDDDFEKQICTVVDNRLFKKEVPVPTIAGIPNIGNSCYIASTIQALRASPILRAKIDEPLQKKGKESDEAFEEREKIHQTLQDLIKSIEANEMESIPYYLLAFRHAVFENKKLNSDLSHWKAIYQKEGKFTKLISYEKKAVDPSYNQQDAAALMMLLLNVIDYHFDLQKKVWVANYPQTEPQIEPYQLLQIEINEGNHQLQDLIIEAFCKKVEQTPYTLEINGEEIGRFTEHNSQIKILSEPDVLIIHLKRFDSSLNKISASAELPENLQLDLSKVFGKSEPVLYESVSSVNHAGSLGGGHYIANAKHNHWMECNDGNVQEIPTLANDSHFQKYLIVLQRVKEAEIDDYNT